MASGITVLAACALTASASAAADGGELPPRRDLFGTRGGKGGRSKVVPPVRGTIELSDGTREKGRLSLTSDLKMTFYDTGAKTWREVALAELARVDARARVEDLDKEWRWKEAGCDEKVCTGRTRPRRWLDHDVTLADGTRFAGHIKGTLIYLETEPEPAKDKGAGGDAKRTRSVKKRFVLRQYHRGYWGQTLDDLIYVKSICVERTVVQKPEKEASPEGVKAKPPASAAGRD